MTAKTDEATERRVPLSRDRVLRAAVALADESDIGSVSMRKVGQELGVEAMSLYNHVKNKDDLLDGMVEIIAGEIELVPARADWKAGMRSQILEARRVMLQHKWAPGVLETRTFVSPTLMRYFNALLGMFRQGGFSYDMAHHAMHVMGSRMLGFTQELFEPDSDSDADEESEQILLSMADELPFMIEMMAEIAHDGPDDTIGWCDDQTEFEFGIDLILDGLERHRAGP